MVCSTPASKSLINSRLVRNRLEERQKKKKIKREGGGRRGEERWTSSGAGRTRCYISREKRTCRRELKTFFSMILPFRFPLIIEKPCLHLSSLQNQMKILFISRRGSVSKFFQINFFNESTAPFRGEIWSGIL